MALKIALHVTLVLLKIMFWPFVMMFRKYQSSWKYAMATTEEKFHMKTEVNHDRVVSARAQIIEVAIESSFQPILQLYLLLPLLINQFICYSKSQVFTTSSINDISNQVSKIQLFSIISSIVSLSWSFSFYQSIKKKGALDFGTNMMGRILLLISNTLQISSRLCDFDTLPSLLSFFKVAPRWC